MLCENGNPIRTLSFGWDAHDKSKGFDFGRDSHDNSTGYAHDIDKPTEFDSDSEMKTGLKYLILSRTIDAPRITADEINDRSKGDAISKGLALFQTTWFIVQCFARWSAHISVTELEIITLAFAMLNGIAYVLWWNKPQNVGFPVYLEKRASSFRLVSPGNIGEHQSPLPAEESQNISRKFESTLLTGKEITPLTVPTTIETPARAHLEFRRISTDSGTMHGAQYIEGNGYLDPRKVNQKDTTYDQAETAFCDDPFPDLPLLVKFRNSARHTPIAYQNLTSEDTLVYAVSRPRQRLTTKWTLFSNNIRALLSTSAKFIFAAFRRLRKIYGSPQYQSEKLGVLRVPMFHAESEIVRGRVEHARIVYLSTVCVLFGCAHLIPSFFLYVPSRTEMWLWRIAAGVITTQPAVHLLCFFVYEALLIFYKKRREMLEAWGPILLRVGEISGVIVNVVVIHGAPFYIIARITLITLSFLSLRNLPDDAFFTIDWVSSIPHL